MTCGKRCPPRGGDRHGLHDPAHRRFLSDRNPQPGHKGTELAQRYLTAEDTLRKTWNNWLRLRRKRVHVPSAEP